MNLPGPLRFAPFAVPLLLAACGGSPFATVCTAQGTGFRYAGPHSVPVGTTVEVEAIPNRCLHPDGVAAWSTGAPEVLAIAETRGDAVRLRAVAPGEALISVRMVGELDFRPLLGLDVVAAGPDLSKASTLRRR